MRIDKFDALANLNTASGAVQIYQMDKLETQGAGKIDRLPYSIRVLLESALRHCDGRDATTQDVLNLANWPAQATDRPAMPFFPGRVILQDFTGVPVVVDLAAMRSAMLRLGSDPKQINPVMPVDLVIDHSVQVDVYGTPDAFQRNAQIEFERNRERYELLHWAQNSFRNLRVVPPATGIVHQVNMEYLARGVLTREGNGKVTAFPDTLVGTDSHTTMINGLGVVGWGVGGIEAIAAMLGQPVDMLIPDVVGFRLKGRLPEGATPTDLTLTVTQMLRKKGVVNKFVEFYGPGLVSLALTDRAMIANMSPENGATITFFPIDEQTLAYLRLTGRPPELLDLVEKYAKTQHLFHTPGSSEPEYSDTLELDLGSVEPSLAGPNRPQDRIPMRQMKDAFRQALAKSSKEGGFGLGQTELSRHSTVSMEQGKATMGHGAVVIAAITSCTNTSNPFVMIAAGLLAKRALEKGLSVKPYVKTSLAPGSRVVTDYLAKAGLMEPLAELGFSLVGYGCTTCIGNSGPLDDRVVQAIKGSNLVAAAVLSGNRNFEGRIHPYTMANYLASPPLVIAYALAGTVEIDLTAEPLGTDRAGQPVYLRDLWPSSKEVQETITNNVDASMFRSSYADVFSGNDVWNQIEGAGSEIYAWKDDSTYIQEPPYFAELSARPPAIANIRGARPLVVLGDSVTTDHISPAGAIPANGAAGKYLQEQGVTIHDFNSFGSRRGNDRVMTRGTFGNIRLKNQLVPGVEGSFTLHFPDEIQMSIYDAAVQYKAEGVPLIVLAGKEYGTGSSRDWAAKGTFLLGVKAVLAESFERIHRSNLVGMGVLPLQYKDGQNAASLGLTGREVYDVAIEAALNLPGGEISVSARRQDGSQIEFQVVKRLDTPLEVEYYRNGGIMQTYLYRQLKAI
ncbi:MAG: aconitate hydratase AcnA [Chloroflexi bacterium]|nr:aconitate hydratase AcnA [Chloroflexota bacterium]